MVVFDHLSQKYWNGTRNWNGLGSLVKRDVRSHVKVEDIVQASIEFLLKGADSDSS